MSSEKQKLLRRLQATRFAVIEINLYLDSHPTCSEGLKYFRSKSEELKKLTEEYQEKYGPLCAADSKAENYWDWVSTAFPWERGES